MSKHTPGPWNWFASDRGDLQLATEHSGRLYVMQPVRNGMQGATLRFSRWGAGPRGRRGGIMERFDAFMVAGELRHPDALLIAASPELLAALEAEQEWREREAAGALDPEWDYERMVGDKRRAAIAKATGAAP